MNCRRVSLIVAALALAIPMSARTDAQGKVNAPADVMVHFGDPNRQGWRGL